METKVRKKDIFNIPNILSIFRIILIPLFVITYMKASEAAENYYYVAASVLIVSGLTDMLDGIIARHFNQITPLGKILDPFADKLTQLTVVICLAVKLRSLPIAIALMFFVIKEMLMLIAGFIMLRRNIKINGSKWFGKLATVVFYVVMALITMVNNMSVEMMLALILFASFFMIFAFIGYISELRKILSENKTQTKEQ